MAETTVIGNGSAQVPPANITEKRPVGRPRNDGRPAGSPPLDQFAEPDEFLLMLPTMTQEEWQYRSVYLYRQYPITDRRGTGNSIYLTKYGEPVDRDRIMRDFGSGVYKLELLETLPNQKGKKLAACTCSIINMDYPPKVPPGEWVNDPRNTDWEWCRQKLGPDKINGQGLSADDVLKLQAAMPKGDSSASLLAAIAPMLDPQRQTDMLSTFASLMKPNQDTSLSTLLLPLMLKLLDKPAADPVVTMLMEDRKAMREEMAEVRRQFAERKPEKSPIEWLLENDEVMERARKLFGRGNSGAHTESGWAGVVDKVVEKLGPPIGSIAVAVTSHMMRGPQPPQQQRPNTQTSPPPGLPAPAEQPVRTQPQQQTAEPQQTESQNPEQMKATELWNKYGNAIMQALPFIIDKYKDESGYQVRDWFVSPQRFGNVLWEGLRTEVGVEGFMTIAKQFPDVWKNFQPEEKFRAFMTDFFTVFGDERPDYDDEDDPDEEFTRPRDVK